MHNNKIIYCIGLFFLFIHIGFSQNNKKNNIKSKVDSLSRGMCSDLHYNHEYYDPCDSMNRPIPPFPIKTSFNAELRMNDGKLDTVEFTRVEYDSLQNAFISETASWRNSRDPFRSKYKYVLNNNGTLKEYYGYEFDRDKHLWYLINKTEYTYDSSKRNTSQIEYKVNIQTNSLEKELEYSRWYASNGKLSEYRYIVWNAETISNLCHRKYVYDSLNRNTAEYRFNSATENDTVIKILYYYGEKGLDSVCQYKILKQAQQRWCSGEHKTAFLYTDKGVLTEKVFYAYDYNKHDWQAEKKEVYETDGNNVVTETLFYSEYSIHNEKDHYWINTHKLFPSKKTQYRYNSSVNRIEYRSYSNSNPDIPVWKKNKKCCYCWKNDTLVSSNEYQGNISGLIWEKFEDNQFLVDKNVHFYTYNRKNKRKGKWERSKRVQKLDRGKVIESISSEYEQGTWIDKDKWMKSYDGKGRETMDKIYEYDSNNSALECTSHKEYRYDEKNKTDELFYSMQGNLINHTKYVYDAENRLTEEIEYANNVAWRKTEYQYKTGKNWIEKRGYMILSKNGAQNLEYILQQY